MSLSIKKPEEVINEYINQMKDIYDHFLAFIDNPNADSDKAFKDLVQIIDKHGIEQNKEKFDLFIGFIAH